MIQSKWVCVCFFPHYSLPLQWNPFEFHYGCSAHISNCKEKRLKIIRRFDQEYAQTTSQILLKNLQATSKALEINTSNKQNHQNADTNQTRMNIWLLRQWNGMRKKCKKNIQLAQQSFGILQRAHSTHTNKHETNWRWYLNRASDATLENIAKGQKYNFRLLEMANV